MIAWLRLLIKVGFSLLCGGILFTVWLALFLLTNNLVSPILVTVLWFIAPVITASGFAMGIIIYERLTKTRRTKFVQAFIWALVGCILGALVVYWFGPMLIVFGMLIMGTAAIAVREVVMYWRSIHYRSK
jgi:hypothetical protein